MKEIDYNNFDKLEIYAKKNKVDMIIKCYEAFSWTLFEKEENSRYADTYNLTFIRPHKIENKDFLQYHQIEMENNLNKIGKIEKNRHSKSTIWGLIFGLLLIGFTFLSISLFKVRTILNYIFAIASVCLAITLLLLSIFLIPKIYKKEKKIFSKQNELLQKNLKLICEMTQKKGKQ